MMNNQQAMALKNCPFCGGEPEQITDKWANYFWVGCKDDDCPAVAKGYKLTEEKEIAIQKWNNRAELLAMCVCGHNEPAHDETEQKFCDAWDCSCAAFQDAHR